MYSSWTYRGWIALGCLIGLTIFSIPSSTFAQYEYRIGKGQSSIEPDKHILSLSLAGYGAPREGRFSLEWKARASLGSVADATIVGDRLYMLQEGKVFRLDLDDLKAEKKVLKQSGQLKLLAGNEKTLFALNTDNELLEAIPSHRKGLKWRHKAVLQQTPRSLSYWNGHFVLLDTAGMLWVATDRPGLLVWDNLAKCKGAIDIMVNKDNIYVLTDKQEILQYKGSEGWLRIAIHNGITYNQDIRILMASSKGFWSMDGIGVLYKAQHNSTGQLSLGALVIQQGKERIAILGADVCGFDASFVNAVKQDIQQAFGIPPAAVMINASHTHFAPVTQDWSTWGPHCQKPDSIYLNTVVRAGIMDAIRQATKSMKPANLYVGKSEAEIGHNRSLHDKDKPYDKALDVIRVDYEHLAEDDLVFSVGCHPVFHDEGKEGITLSPNYPGVARELLLQDSKVRSAMFIQGCGGDINPIDADHRLTGKKVASAVTDMLNRGDMQQIKGSIGFFLDTIAFDTHPWPEATLREFRAGNEGAEGNIAAEKNVRWADLMLKHHKNGTMPATMPVFIQTFNVGNWKLVGISRETTTEYSLGIKALWPDKLVTVAGYCNDVSSYLPTRRHIKVGSYEGHDSFFWYGQPNVFPEDVYEKIIEFIESLNR